MENSTSMHLQLEQICAQRFPVDDGQAQSKVVPLSEAVRSWIRPGQSLHFSFTHNRAHAAAWEIARQFWGTDPAFDLIATGILEYGILLIHGGLVKKVVAAFYGDTYPTASPNPILQAAFSSGRVELESWTNLTIPLRLMAAAYNLPFITSNSLLGSTMETENQKDCRVVDNPWSPGGKTALLTPLKPDIAIVHAWAADPQGNTILLPPYGENAWGAFAAREGVLVTTERIVSPSFIRQYSNYVKIPAYQVRSVSVVPFGAHPQGMSNHGLPELDTYGDDHQFRIDFRNASRDPKRFDEWVEEWVLGCRTHQDYLDKLGFERLMRLKGEAGDNSWTHFMQDKAGRRSQSESYTPTELMAVIVSRIIRQKVLKSDFKHVLAGIGLSSLASTLAYYRLKNEEQRIIELLIETGFYGCAPRPGDPFVFNFANIPTSKMQSNFVDVLNLFAGGNNNQCLGVLATGQVDAHGNLNSTRLADGRYLVGAGGSNDIACGSREVIVMLKQSRSRWLEALPYTTSQGDRVKTLVSDRAIFRKYEDGGPFVLIGCLPDPQGGSLAERIAAAKDRCGWDLQVADEVEDVPPPDADELEAIRLLDPLRHFTA
ncbi:3-oxoacid CoA-transferase [Desulfosarcina ovata subsp. sediminis]|uniref:3-oxoacid CoA-transferase n=1 Tax=Desulfosarcina ovata subsp. sediminis TaxID=885957 RepID=A0A5K7ZVF2_9BACT|nr:CoA-transferase [Desulfosarcina ovata]BBO84178.1 3-oxoacid CoA-transferase [Desulfosarcina ovata subsp. sediminis]